MKRAYVFFNGELLGDKKYYKNILENQKGDIFCADGGANILETLDLFPLEIWGDLDSVEEDILEKYRKNGVCIKKFPREKDFTDGELLLSYLKEKEYDEIIIFGGLGGRHDHELTNLSLMFKFENVVFSSMYEDIFAIKKDCVIEGKKGYTISFVPFSNEVTELTLRGFKYELEKYTLKLGDTICMSNIVEKDIATVSFKEGSLLGIIIK